MSIEFKATNPPNEIIKYNDNVIIGGVIVRTEDLPRGVETKDLGFYKSSDGRYYQAELNIYVTSKEILLWPGRTKKAPQNGIEIKYTRFAEGLPVRLNVNDKLTEGRL
jgi:hypothetical protein